MNKIIVFIRPVSRKPEEYKYHEITNDKAEKIVEVIFQLSRKGDEELFDNLKLSERLNTRTWVNELLMHEKNVDFLKNDLKYLVSDFADAMKTSMRKEGRCVVGFAWRDHVFLAHTSCGEETISTSIDVIERLLDSDNVRRFVFIYRDRETVKVRFYEYIRSQSFKEWLGLRGGKYTYYESGGSVNIYVDIFGLEARINLPFDKAYEILSGNNKVIYTDGNEMIFSKSIKSAYIKRIRYQDKEFKDPKEFIKMFKITKMGLDNLIKIARKLEILTNFFPNSEIIDHLDRVEIRLNDNIESYVKDAEDIIGIFGDGERVKLSNEFIELLLSKFLNDEETKIVFLSNKELRGKYISLKPLRIRNFLIYNDIKLPKNIHALIEYYSNRDFPTNLKMIIGIVLFKLLADKLSRNESFKSIAYLLKALHMRIIQLVVKEYRDMRHVFISEDDFIELKSRDFLVGSNKHIVEKLSTDIERKLQKTSLKVYFIGINEKDETIEFMQASRYDDSRLNELKSLITKKLTKRGLDVKIEFYPINIDKYSKMILLIVERNEDTSIR